MNTFQTMLMGIMLRGVLCSLLYSPALLHAHSDQPPADGERWIWINTQSNTLQVMQGEQTLKSFQNISVGRNGSAPVRQRGDGKTPLGTFHVRWINRDSRYHVFLGIDYPNVEQAETAWRNSIIDFDTYYNIRVALIKGRVPPQNTALGGYIGIHGTGNTSERFHKYINWTQGCVALTNRQIEQLSGMVGIGTLVVISDGMMLPANTSSTDANTRHENANNRKVSLTP